MTEEGDAGGSDALNQELDATVWSQDDLVRRLCLALQIAQRAIEFLGQAGHRDEDEPESSFGPDKPLAEAAMLLYVAAAAKEHRGVKELHEDLCTLLATLARSERAAIAIALHPTICLQLAMPHVLLSRLGLPDTRLDRLLALSVESSAHHGQEVVPNRALEKMWIKSTWTGTTPGLDFDAIAFDSALNMPLDLIWGAREDAYAHTHAFMYFTDFGYARRPLPRARADVLAESATILTRSLLFEDYDLAAEVLMAWPLTSAPWSPVAAFGFRVLTELEDSVGFLPAKNGTPERYSRLEGEERTKYALAASYHTAFVMGMLCALTLRPGNAPPARITGPHSAEDNVEQLLALIPDVTTPWRTSFDKLSFAEKRALEPLLLDMALLSAGQSHDYTTLAGLLELADRQNMADTLLCAQAAELLQRMSTCAETAV